MALIGTLISNGNRVGFWTSVTEERLNEMRKAMKPEIAALPVITRDGFTRVISAFQDRARGQLGDEAVLAVMREVKRFLAMRTCWQD